MNNELNELVTELGKLVNGNLDIVLQSEKLESLYKKWKWKLDKVFKYPFHKNEKYWLVDEKGEVKGLKWDTDSFDQPRYNQGHILKTKQEAERERDKRALLTRFREFRDECNGDWKPIFKMDSEPAYKCDYKNAYIISFHAGKLESECAPRIEQFYLFGYFKNYEDCNTAIELFGDEIKRLFVEVE